MRVKIDDAGRIQLPEDLQRQLGVEPGDDVILEKQGKEWFIRRSHEGDGLRWEGNVLVHEGNSATDAAIETGIDELRSDRSEQLEDGMASPRL